jgi:hypothetical protein
MKHVCFEGAPAMSNISNISVTAAQSYATVAPQSQPSLQPFANLNLTEAQRTALRAAFATAKQDGTSPADLQKQVSALLTPAQQQTFAADLKAGKAGHHHREDADFAPKVAAASDSSASSASTASTSTDDTVLDAVTNIQNQAAAAQSTLIANLQKSLLGTADAETDA